MEYLGSLGRLIGLPCNSEERTSAAARYVTESTVEGRRRVQVVPASPRTWSVSWDMSEPGELAGLTPFVLGAWGNGPWHWVPVQAQQGNLLTPREALLLDRVQASYVLDAGPVRGADGSWSATSVAPDFLSGWISLFRGVPVVPGLPFTWSVDVQGSVAAPDIRVAFYDAAGGAVGGGSVTGSGVGMQRLSVSAVVPAGAVEARVGVHSSVVRATRPQVTWTPGPVPFSAGHGCRSAIVDGLSEDLLVANRFGTYSDVGFTVLEVS